MGSARLKGQISVEFFLVLAVIIAFTIILYANASVQVERSFVLQHAVIAQSLVDSFASTANFVYLSGPGAKITKTFYVPAETACFYVEDCNAPPYPVENGVPVSSSDCQARYLNRVYCTLASDELQNMVSGTEQSVYSQELVFTGFGSSSKFVFDASACIPATAALFPLAAGDWHALVFENTGGTVTVSC